MNVLSTFKVGELFCGIRVIPFLIFSTLVGLLDVTHRKLRNICACLYL